MEILFDQQDRLARSFRARKASIMLRTITGARPLVGSSTSSSRRGSAMARAIASICFWPPERLPAGRFQKRLSAGKRPKIQSRRSASTGPLRAASSDVLAHREIGEDAHGFRHVGDAGARDVGRGQLGDVAAVENDAARGGLPQAHDGAQGRGFAGAVAAEQHRQPAAGIANRRRAGCDTGRYACARRGQSGAAMALLASSGVRLARRDRPPARSARR